MLVGSGFDRQAMQTALKLAQQAAELGEVPVGAVVVIGGEIVGQGYNRTIIDIDPTAHAEVVALRDAAKQCGNHRFQQATLYVTLEPCVMCAGAILQARIDHLVYGAHDPKFGAAGSLINLPESPFMNHHCRIRVGVLKDECSTMLSQFFATKR